MGQSRAVSLFGGGRREPRERTAEDRRQALIERERRRTGNPNWHPPEGHPLFAAPAAGPRNAAPNGAAAPQTPQSAQQRAAQRAPERPAPQRASAVTGGARTADPAARAPQAPADGDAGWWDDGDLHDLGNGASAWPPPAPDAAPVLRPRQPAPRPEPEAPLLIEPDPPAPPPAEAFELPDIRTVAVHRRRGPRTVVSPPGAANMGGKLPGPSRRRRVVVGVLALAVFLLAWSQWKLWQPLKGGGSGDVVVEIPQGASASEVAAKLQDAGVIDSATLFGLRALIAGKRQDLVAGTLQMKVDMSYGAALAQLSGSKPSATFETTSVMVQEGLSIRENARRFKRQSLLKDYGATAKQVFKERRSQLRTIYKMPASVDSLEGFLFPAKYELPLPVDSTDLIVRQLQSFQQTFSPISLTRAKKANLTPYDVLIIASMVEREARLTRERKLIAAVIYNRLKAGMPLGIDATFRYASGDWTNPIRQSELEKDGPYNSRLRKGLPPTPIGNPGLASIEAAAAPANVNYLYFVVKPGRCGEHAFSATIEKFTADTAKYNQAREALGKSPVTC
jgi:UPF0755 protein